MGKSIMADVENFLVIVWTMVGVCPEFFSLRREIRRIDHVIVVLAGLVMARMSYVEDYCCCV